MKKFFFMAATMLATVSMNAETVFDWSNKVGQIELTGTTVEEQVKSQTNSVYTPCISFNNGYAVDAETNEATNYAQLTLAEGGFKTGDFVVIDFFFNNSDNTKVATVAVYNTKDQALAESSKGLNGKVSNGYTNFMYELTEDMDTIRIARGKSGKTKTCVARLEVVRGGVVIAKAGEPVFSVASGEYFDPFSFELSASPSDKIFYRLDGGAYQEYTGAIEVSEYDREFVYEAYATLEGSENSNVVKATYKLKHFVPRPVFQARKTIDLSGITSGDIQIESGDNGILSTRSMDGETCPTVAYKRLANLEATDSLLLISFKNREGLLMRYKNGSDKNPALTAHSKYLQTDSKNFEMYVDGVEGGDTVVFVVTAKGSAPSFDYGYSSACYIDPYQPDDEEDLCFTDGAVFTASDAKIENDYSGWTNLVFIVQEGHTKIRLKEVSNGFRIAKIQIGAFRTAAPMGIEDNFMNQKAVKRFVDGQMVIEKGGRRFNVLGTEIK